MNRGFASIGLVVALLAVILIAGGGWWYLNRSTITDTAVTDASFGNDPSLFEPNPTAAPKAAKQKPTQVETASSWQEKDVSEFTISLPPGWKYVPQQGTDSFVGEFTGDNIRIHFDYGRYGGVPSKQPASMVGYTVAYETVSGRPAEVMVPKVAGKGEVGIYIHVDDSPTMSTGLRIAGTDIPAQFQETVYKIARSVRLK